MVANVEDSVKAQENHRPRGILANLDREGAGCECMRGSEHEWRAISREGLAAFVLRWRNESARHGNEHWGPIQ